MSINTQGPFVGLGDPSGGDSPFVPQPFAAHVDVWIGDKLITGGELDGSALNFSLVSFTHTMETSGTAHSFNLVLFDKSWVELEQLLSLHGNQVKFNYYYYSAGFVKGKQSRNYEGTILKWVPMLTQSGTLLSIEGIGGVASKHSEKTRSWGGPPKGEDPKILEKLKEVYDKKFRECGIRVEPSAKGLRISDIVELIASGLLDPDLGAGQKKPWKTWAVHYGQWQQLYSTVEVT